MKLERADLARRSEELGAKPMNAGAGKDIHAGLNTVLVARPGLRAPWRSIFMTPTLHQLSPVIQHFPFIAWSVDTLKPRRCILVGSFDAPAYFGLCQACEQFAPEAEVYFSALGRESQDDDIDKSTLNYASRNYPHIARLNSAAELPREYQFDMLLWIPGQGSSSFELDEWRKRLASSAMIMVHGICEKTFTLDESGDLSWTLEFTHGQGLGVVGFGEIKRAIQVLASGEEDPNGLLFQKELFARLGNACADNVAAAISSQQLDEARKSLEFRKKKIIEKDEALKSAEAQLKSRALEIEELWSKIHFQADQHQVERGRLLEKANLYREWRDDCRAEADRLQSALRQNREKAAKVERDFEIKIHLFEERASKAERDLAFKSAEVDRLNLELQERFSELANLTRNLDPVLGRQRGVVRFFGKGGRRLSQFLSPINWYRQRVLKRHAAQIAASGFFDESWYERSYPDVKNSGFKPALHFLKIGALEGRNPGPNFNTRAYLNQNPDVAQSGMNPLVHYLEYGRAEGRSVETVK